MNHKQILERVDAMAKRPDMWAMTREAYVLQLVVLLEVAGDKNAKAMLDYPIVNMLNADDGRRAVFLREGSEVVHGPPQKSFVEMVIERFHEHWKAIPV